MLTTLPQHRYESLSSLRERVAAAGDDWLSPGERGAAAGWRDGGRREAWLCGRWLAKELVASRFNDRDLSLSTVELLARDDARGRSMRPTLGIEGRPCDWSVSISHTDRGVLAALATAPGASVGVDLTPAVAHSRGFVETWFTPAERALAASGDECEAARIWALKEAIYKACNDGESFSPRQVEIERPAEGGRWNCRYFGVPLAGCLETFDWEVDGQIAVLAVFDRQSYAAGMR